MVSGPTFLTGICHCAKCGGAMTIRTVKGGRYRYYACSIKARQGETGCEGRSIPMDKLDGVVIDHIEREFLDPSRLEIVLSAVLDRRQERREHIAKLNKCAAETELRLKRLYDAIEAGVTDLDDPALKDRIEGLRALRDQAKCQSARKFDPVSASNFDPFARRDWRVALDSSELAGIAETRRARAA